MENNFIKEAKKIRDRAKWSSIICWVDMMLLLYSAPDMVEVCVIITLISIVFTIIYLRMRWHIIDFEKLKE
jgi:hypothetical protein